MVIMFRYCVYTYLSPAIARIFVIFYPRYTTSCLQEVDIDDVYIHVHTYTE